MKRILFISLLWSALNAVLFADNAAAVATLSGHTVLKHGNEHIGYIHISVKGTTIGTATDAGGHYTLRNVPAGKQLLVASGVGFKTVEIPVELGPGASLKVNFELEEDAVMLENVVVSANRNETKRSEASNIVNVITPKLFETTNSVCLAQSLNYQPGLRVENNCQNCGFQQVRINGLEGPYTQILIDSRPIFSALAGVYGIEQIPTNMIERVEVVRGGGSALFGSNAIAGTINIITKEPLANSLTIANTTMLIGGSKTDFNTTVNAALVSDNNKAGISLYGSSRQREAWDANGDGFTEIGLIRAGSLGFRSYFKTSNQSKLTLEYHNLEEFRRGGNNLHLPAHDADITEQTDHLINSGGLKWEVFSPDYRHRAQFYSSAQHIRRDSYYGADQDPKAYGLTNDLAVVAGGQYVYAMKKFLFMPADLTLGAEYSFNHLVDTQLAYDRDIDQKVNISSAFLQNEWKNKTLSLLLGLRMDKHNLIDRPIISPRVNVRYNPTEWVNLRTSFAKGFRAPQAFDEDLHITAVGGEVQLIKLDENLRPEHSNSFSASAEFNPDFGKVLTNFVIEGFYTDINDVFYLNETGTDTLGNTILTRTNGLGAVVKGINLEARIVPNAKSSLQAGFTLQSSLYKEAQTWSSNEALKPIRQMFRSPGRYGYVTFSYTPVKPLTLALSGTYTGPMLVQHFGPDPSTDKEVWTPDFYDVNLKASYDIRIDGSMLLQLNAGVQNLFNSFQNDFDTGVTRDAGYMYGPSLPRSYFAGIKLML
ncbi:MAG: TonB-dependent receptor [Paludibacter sp. 47-17]|nr:MAG: TonB-dependent receptor [Paludibacter sp. 47-17]